MVDPAPGDAVEGWLHAASATITARLLQRQTAIGLGGNVMEIGVHHGRYFLVLAEGLAAGESALAVDIFAAQHLNVSNSGRGDQRIFEDNLARFLPHIPVTVVAADSTTLGDDDFIAQHAGMRFISVDGGHDRATVRHDLTLCESLLASGGLVALDDIYRPDWSGVTAGLARYFWEGGFLVPVAFIPNKLLLTTDPLWAARYRNHLRDAFPQLCSRDHASLEVFDHDDVLLLEGV